MKSLLIAIGFLTKMPIPQRLAADDKNLSKSMIFFPVVGLLLGLILVLARAALAPFLPDSLVNLVIISALILSTGALHLDGFADTLDGLCAKTKDKNKILEIMRDSRIGAMGVIGLIVLILFKYEALNNISPQFKNISLILMCSLSRWAQVMVSHFSKYARESDGLGRPFIGNVRQTDFYLATALAICISLTAWFPAGLWVFALVFAFAWSGMKYINKKIGGMTGDTVGFISELAEVLILFSVGIATRGTL